LQTILKDAGTSNDQEIPVPPPEESAIDYDALYPSQFHQPSSYIRFSQTVEECISCQYDMTVEDDTFLKEYNSKRPATGSLSEDDFEYIMEVFEDTAAEQTPFASVDNTVVAYEMMVPGLNHLDSQHILQHAKAIYEYWRTRRQEMGNKPIHPTLKFETHQESDDTDPYVCFRRREARQTRKTRARDNKIADTLKRLRRELEDGRQLVILSAEREVMKLELLHADRAVFEERARLKQMKIKLGIKEGDEDLVNQKVCQLEPFQLRLRHVILTFLFSLRSAKLQKLRLCKDLQPPCECLCAQTAGRSTLTSPCCPTSLPRRRMNSEQTSS
jgi:enhancer of polycomb-like protein